MVRAYLSNIFNYLNFADVTTCRTKLTITSEKKYSIRQTPQSPQISSLHHGKRLSLAKEWEIQAKPSLLSDPGSRFFGWGEQSEQPDRFWSGFCSESWISRGAHGARRGALWRPPQRAQPAQSDFLWWFTSFLKVSKGFLNSKGFVKAFLRT